jgi:hypothetical protein
MVHEKGIELAGCRSWFQFSKLYMMLCKTRPGKRLFAFDMRAANMFLTYLCLGTSSAWQALRHGAAGKEQALAAAELLRLKGKHFAVCGS